jgi:N-(2-amino-2-carboxyethyl)-L-glutamate synthase
MQAIRVHVRGLTRLLWLKLEWHNPSGSIKFRTAIGLLSALSAQVPLRPGNRVIESTSGNLGLAMARLLTEMDCQFIAIIDPKVAPSMRAAMRAAGAVLVIVSEPDVKTSYLLQRLHKVKKLQAEDAGLHWTDQYHSLANPAIHQDVTAMEILRQTDGAVDMLLAAVSTGGTLAGLSAGLRACRPGIQICAVDAQGSLVTSETNASLPICSPGSERHASRISCARAPTTAPCRSATLRRSPSAACWWKTSHCAPGDRPGRSSPPTPGWSRTPGRGTSARSRYWPTAVTTTARP